MDGDKREEEDGEGSEHDPVPEIECPDVEQPRWRGFMC